MTTDSAAGIAVAVATMLLVIITAVYAYQTRETVKELKAQRDEARNLEQSRRRDTVLGISHAVNTELRQILLLTQDADHWQASSEFNYIRLPVEAWHAALQHPDAIGDPVRRRLLEVYSLVARINALSEVLLTTDLDKTHFRSARTLLARSLLPVLREAIIALDPGSGSA